jgi:cytochrome c oxidase subunit 4
MEPSMSDHGSAAAPGPHSHAGRYVVVWAALMALTALTWGLSTVHVPGFAGVALALAIAIVKGTLVALFFMHLWDHSGPNRLVLITSLIFVVLLIILPLLDNATRFPLANPPDSEMAPQRIRDAILNEAPARPAPAHPAPAHP